MTATKAPHAPSLDGTVNRDRRAPPGSLPPGAGPVQPTVTQTVVFALAAAPNTPAVRGPCHGDSERGGAVFPPARVPRPVPQRLGLMTEVTKAIGGVVVVVVRSRAHARIVPSDESPVQDDEEEAALVRRERSPSSSPPAAARVRRIPRWRAVCASNQTRPAPAIPLASADPPSPPQCATAEFIIAMVGIRYSAALSGPAGMNPHRLATAPDREGPGVCAGRVRWPLRRRFSVSRHLVAMKTLVVPVRLTGSRPVRAPSGAPCT